MIYGDESLTDRGTWESPSKGREITPVPGATPRYDDAGREIVDIATCGQCGRSWNDAATSSLTPVPSGRCPFEYEHKDEDGFVPCPECGVNLVDPDFQGADGRSVCDECRDENRALSHGRSAVPRDWIAGVSEDDMWILREALILMSQEIAGTMGDYERGLPGITERVSGLAHDLGVTA